MTEDQKTLIQDNVPLAYYVAKRWKDNTHLEFDDIVSLCQLGLVKAALKYNPDKGVKFSTYAIPSMDNEIKQEIRKSRKIISAISIDTPFNEYGDLSIKDAIADEKDYFSYLFIEDTLKDFIGCLTESERIVIMTKISYPDATQEEYGKMLGISQSFYSRILKSAKKKLKEM